MELGEKIRAARLGAGLSQRQLCGEEITRNMLSLIENGSARPSMKTLEYLARKLGKPLSYFLDAHAEEKQTLGESWVLLNRAEVALNQGRQELARDLLEKAAFSQPELERKRLLLLSFAYLLYISGFSDLKSFVSSLRDTVLSQDMR